MKIIEIKEYQDEFLNAVNALLPQLTVSAGPLSENGLRQIIASDASTLLLATDNSLILGMLTLVRFETPTGIRARIEDVVVDQKSRGSGIGRSLIEHAIRLAKTLDIKTIDLTSHPSRITANRLYTKAGFELRETNIYRYGISG